MLAQASVITLIIASFFVKDAKWKGVSPFFIRDYVEFQEANLLDQNGLSRTVKSHPDK